MWSPKSSALQNNQKSLLVDKATNSQLSKTTKKTFSLFQHNEAQNSNQSSYEEEKSEITHQLPRPPFSSNHSQKNCLISYEPLTDDNTVALGHNQYISINTLFDLYTTTLENQIKEYPDVPVRFQEINHIINGINIALIIPVITSKPKLETNGPIIDIANLIKQMISTNTSNECSFFAKRLQIISKVVVNFNNAISLTTPKDLLATVNQQILSETSECKSVHDILTVLHTYTEQASTIGKGDENIADHTYSSKAAKLLHFFWTKICTSEQRKFLLEDHSFSEFIRILSRDGQIFAGSAGEPDYLKSPYWKIGQIDSPRYCLESARECLSDYIDNDTNSKKCSRLLLQLLPDDWYKELSYDCGYNSQADVRPYTPTVSKQEDKLSINRLKLLETLSIARQTIISNTSDLDLTNYSIGYMQKAMLIGLNHAKSSLSNRFLLKNSTANKNQAIIKLIEELRLISPSATSADIARSELESIHNRAMVLLSQQRATIFKNPFGTSSRQAYMNILQIAGVQIA